MSRRNAQYVLAGALALTMVSEPLLAASAKKLNKRIDSAKEYLDELMTDTNTAIPQGLIKTCAGVVILRQYKAGFVFGVKGGFGVVMFKNKETGEWSPPAFITNAEGSFGFQIGGQAIDSVLLIMNEDGLKMLLKSKFKVGVDASAAAGPVGRDAEAKMAVGTAILVYSKAKGLYAGAAFEGGFLVPDNGANEEFYDLKEVSLEDILLKGKVAMPEEAKPLRDSLKKHSR